MNNLLKLIDYGQSYWLDNLTRKMIKNGDLKKRVGKEGLRGITSNPAIFNKAISGGSDYNAQIKQLVKQKKSVREIYEELTVKDVQDACDILRKVYNESSGLDGFISLEVSPYLAHDTNGTMEEARRLFKKVNRPNCFIKIPGTREGVPAIEQMLYEGININVTLLFSIEAYEAVAYAYVNALDRRAAEGKEIKNLASVASFFLSRIDVLADQLLGHLTIPENTKRDYPRPENLLGKAAIASAKLAYQSFKKIFSGERWERLAEKGASVQRPLWASTSTKDPLYSDVKYVEPLIGPDTVNTMPEVTISAFADHGQIIENSIESGVDEARKLFEDLKTVGVDINFVTEQLVHEGVQKFIDPFNNLMKTLSIERNKVLGSQAGSQHLAPGKSKSDVKSGIESLNEKQFARRVFAKDPFLWKSDSKSVQAIRDRLGWLNIEQFVEKTDELTSFANEIKKEKFKHVVLLGMGGSSLCPEVSKLTFGSKKGYPELIVLDNTDPAAVQEVSSIIDYSTTLFIVASKSGTTTETLSFYRHFYDELYKKGIEKTGKHFIAITDGGTPLEEEARQKDFRKIFTNPDDFGGRYSALSFFGLVPMALIGIDVKSLLNNAHQFQLSCGPFIPAEENQGVSLGTLLGINQKLGKDKITFIPSSSVSAFGYWVEQLIAESTGKEGSGLVPIEGEDLGTASNYSNDRVFVYIHAGNDEKSKEEKKLQSLEKEGHPIVKIDIKDKLSIGAEYFRWELATATAGKIIGVNPFNEPNVAESKKNSKDLLNEWENKGSFSEGEPVVKTEEIEIYADSSSEWFQKVSKGSVKSFLNSFTKLAKTPDYIVLLAYSVKTPVREKSLQKIRLDLRNKLKVATTVGYGPRYMHSTGQLHKGGPNTGVFLLFTYDHENDLPIPGNNYGFATLQRAQALGDFRSLVGKNRRVVRIHLGKNIDANLKKIQEYLK
jgi:transaldolase/glucose-6-phosphate isomerase